MLISQMGLYPLWLNLPMQQLFWTKCFSTTTKDSGPCMEVRLILRWSRNNFYTPRCSEKKKVQEILFTTKSMHLLWLLSSGWKRFASYTHTANICAIQSFPRRLKVKIYIWSKSEKVLTVTDNYFYRLMLKMLAQRDNLVMPVVIITSPSKPEIDFG